jgi:hypothetical protein
MHTKRQDEPSSDARRNQGQLEGVTNHNGLHPISEEWFAVKHGAGHPQ